MRQNESYTKGKKNWVVRQYFYVQRGLALLNEFRYLFMGILAAYYTLKMDNPAIIVIMFILAVPALCFVGWVSVHYVAKVLDFLNIEYATTWGRYTYDLAEKQIQLLEDIKSSLDKEDKSSCATSSS